MNSDMQALNDARLLALQNQITPHYIANTLDAIRMKLLMDGQDETAELLRIFMDSLRTYTSGPQETISVREEIAFLDQFLKLQNFRFLNRLTWDISVSKDLFDFQIPRFILQPLVENTVRHGFSGAVDSPHLTLDAYRDGDFLYFVLMDTGIGIPPEKLRELHSGTLPITSIGYKNVCERLNLLYGSRAGIQITSSAGKGTRAVIKMPIEGCDSV